jgi:kynureninase
MSKQGNEMLQKSWNLNKDIKQIRKIFPILDHCVYLISNSLGAVPFRVQDDLQRFYALWAEEGVSAWQKEWWELPQKVGNEVASLIGAEDDCVSMMTNATLGHWVVLSTQFLKTQKRKKVIITDYDFPSIMYCISQICSFMGWELDVVTGRGKTGPSADEIIQRVDEQTLFIATSHVYFKSAYVQDISRIAHHARRVGALSLIDGYHAPGTLPVDVKALGVDFYIGGCLKWLCGGPGNAFLYVRPDLQNSLFPHLTGWFAHKNPFSFSTQMEYTDGSFRFMSGTPPVTALYTARAGLEVIGQIGMAQIRQKSLDQTRLIIKNAKERGFALQTPEKDELRGGAVSLGMPHAYQVKQALMERKVKVDFRKGNKSEDDVVRIGPHFYTEDDEINFLFSTIDEISSSGEYKKYSGKTELVT